MSHNLIGRILLKQYRVDSFLAAGGMGAVYRVWDEYRQVPLAMKVLHSDLADDPSILKRFKREANALKKLTHPNIVPFYGLHQSGRLAFLLTQYVDGPSLKEVLQERRGKLLPIDEALVYLKAVGAALGYAHGHGVVHCDVKPGNVMVDRGGQVYLTDFGIARHAESTTTTLGFAGTAAYMAPEQVRGEAVTPQADVYALGVMLYEMLCGVRPFRGDEEGTDSAGGTASERIQYAHLNLEPPDPRQHNPALSEELAEVILTALAKDPAARFESARVFFDEVCQAADVDSALVPERAVIPTSAMPEEAFSGSGSASALSVSPAARRKVTRAALVILGNVLLILTICAVILGGVSVVLARIAENAIARANWEYAQPEASFSEQGLSELVTNNVGLYLPGLLDAVTVDLQPPDEVVFIAMQPNGVEFTLSGQVRVSQDGYPVTSLRRLNRLPLTIFGSIISGGINRGFARSLSDAQIRIDEIALSEEEIAFRLSGPGMVAVQPAPTPAPAAPDEVQQDTRALAVHAGPVFAVAWSPNGEWLASASADGKTVVWEPTTGEAQQTFQGHTGEVRDVAWSTDGRLIGSGSLDGQILTGNPETGVETLFEYESPIYSLDFDPRRKALAAGTYSGEILLYSTTRNVVIFTREGHVSRVDDIAFSPNGRLLASGSSDGTIIIWKASIGEQQNRLNAGSGVTGLSWSPDGQRLATATIEGKIDFWNVADGAALNTLILQDTIIRSIAWSPDAAMLAVGTSTGRVILLDVEKNQVMSNLQVGDTVVWDLDWFPDSRSLALALNSGQILIWQLQQPTVTAGPVITTPTASQSLPAPERARQLALEGVSRNADWIPHIEEINGVQMALVPAGCFRMGSEDAYSNEQPVHEVCFEEPFWIDVTEVTNAQFVEFGGQAGRSSQWTAPEHPRERITWTEAAAFCARRGGRLPTETEWEFAARGPDGLVFPWGNTFAGTNVVYGPNSGGRTAPAGSRTGGASWAGALDMSGNVWEWVNDWYSGTYYGTLVAGVVNPPGPGGGEHRVIRGGSWEDTDQRALRGAMRYWGAPSIEDSYGGFRCARSY